MSMTLTEAHAETLGAILEAQASRPALVTTRLVAELSPAVSREQRDRALRDLQQQRLVDRGPTGLRLTDAGVRQLQRL